jgi:DNA-binding response OmpR family regulator
MKILIVDDEPTQARGLSRAILHRRPDYSVLTALNGAEAVALLEEQQVDLVLTDLQMDQMDGFDLLAWILSHRPALLAFAMTGQASEESSRRLSGLGAIECFNKPLDIDALLERLTDGLAQSIRGHVQNVGLASFLQLIELERKTCTLEVRRGDLVGHLYLRKGELLEARVGDASGEQGALAIIGWINASITIHSGCEVNERGIHKPVYHIVMDAMRMRDEVVRKRGTDSERALMRIRDEAIKKRESERAQFKEKGKEKDSFFPLVSDPATGTFRMPRSLDSLHLPVGALALAVVEVATGVVVASEDLANLSVREFAEAAAAMLRRQHSQASPSGAAQAEGVEEVVMTTAKRCELIRMSPNREIFVLLIFDMTQTNLVMARLELERFMMEFAAQ